MQRNYSDKQIREIRKGLNPAELHVIGALYDICVPVLTSLELEMLALRKGLKFTIPQIQNAIQTLYERKLVGIEDGVVNLTTDGMYLFLLTDLRRRGAQKVEAYI